MGVTYKLRDEVVHFIISQRQGNPFFSCRQLAESASQKFGLRLSKSSVHDVLKGSGIVTPRGRKPKNKFEIPQERKKQIQVSLSQVKLLTAMAPPQEKPEADEGANKNILPQEAQVCYPVPASEEKPVSLPVQDEQVPFEYEGAGGIFFKAALWDLGVYSQESIKAEEDWVYFLTYCKGIRVELESHQNFFIDLPLPIERCIREAADGLINNVNPLIVHNVSDRKLLEAGMEAREGFKINKVLIVDHQDQILFEISGIVDVKRSFYEENRLFVESNDNDVLGRVKALFFPEAQVNKEVIDEISKLKGFDHEDAGKNTVTLLIQSSCIYKEALQVAAEKINRMFLHDEENRLVRLNIKEQ
jgi:hypothetical protein